MDIDKFRRTVTIYSNVGAYNVSIDEEEEKMNPRILLSYHDNMHYNSVHDVKGNTGIKSSIQITGSETNKPTEKKPKTKGKKSHIKNDEIDVGKVKNGKNMSAIDPVTDSSTDAMFEQKDDQSKKSKTIIAKSHVSNMSDEKEVKTSMKDNKPKRNDQCPCGSGLRYKKCCLVKEKSKFRLEKFREKYGIQVDGKSQNEVSIEEDHLEIEGAFAVLNI